MVAKWLIILYFLTLSIFVIVSYGFIPGTLTLTQNQTFLQVTGFLTEFGYNRPRTSLIFLTLLIIMTIFYLVLMKKARTLTPKFIFILVCCSTLIITASFPILSRDIFNYIFYTKIILVYHQNPHFIAANQFMFDPQTRFMTWVHVPTPYGGLWTVISLIPAVFGFGKFILSLTAFKIFLAGFHILNVYLIYAILKKINPDQKKLGTIVYAFNPVVLIESLSSAHNDTAMISFGLLAIYLLASGKKRLSLVFVAASIAIKYATIILIPLFFLYIIRGKKLDIGKWGSFIFIIVIAIMVLFLRNFQIWYLLWLIPIAALSPLSFPAKITIALSVGATLRWIFYFYYGDWILPGLFLNDIVALIIVPAIFLVLARLRINFRWSFLKNTKN